MTTNVTGMIKKVMGWCPLKKADSSVDYAVSSGYAHSSNAPAHDNPIKNMDVSVQSFDQCRHRPGKER